MTFTASGEIFTHLLLDRGKTFELFDQSLLDCWATWYMMYQLTLLFRQLLLLDDFLRGLPSEVECFVFNRWGSSHLSSPVACILWLLGKDVLE